MTPILLITLIGAFAAMIVGSIWYSDKTPMGRLHMKSLGFDKMSPEERKKCMEDAKPRMWKLLLGQFVLSAFMAFFVAMISVEGVKNGETMWMVAGYGALAWFCFVVPVVGSSVIWGNVDRKITWKKFISDIVSYLVTIIVFLLIAKLFV